MVARKKNQPLRPMRDLNPRQQSQRRLARKLGFKDERAYRAWVKKYSSLPESDPKHFSRKLSGDARAAEVKRLKRVHARVKSGPKEIVRKSNVLVYGESERISPFKFWDSFGNQIQSTLADPETSARDKALLKRLMNKLHRDMDVPDYLKPGEQATLFG